NGKLDRGALPAPGEQAHRRGAYEPPRAGREQVLAQLWEELLQIPRVGRHDHFFDLGGHSLLAMRLIERARATGIDIALTLLFEDPTLAVLAARAAAIDRDALPACVVRMREGRDRDALFLVHDVSGDTAAYLHVVGLLPEGPAVFGLQTRPGETECHDSVAGMAARYVDAVLRIRPQGPFRLAGWSLGGAIAHEMARQLEASGREVDGVALVDWRGSDDASSARQEPDDALLWRLGGRSGPSAGPASAGPGTRSGEAPDPAVIAMRRRLFRAGTSHVPGPILARVDFLYASDSMDATTARACAQRLGREVNVAEIAGDHWTIMSPPHAAAVAEVLAAAMRGRG
ncbi:MAG: thioesterase domain-containing protein, partial [Pseudomonadota bacterium]